MSSIPLFLRAHELAGLQEVKRQVEAQLDQAPAILRLSRVACMNERKLLAAFKQVFHTTIYEYYLTLKMDWAKQLLRETEDSVSAIAYQVGYAHMSNFCLEFKKRVGVSPAQWRRNSRLKG